MSGPRSILVAAFVACAAAGPADAQPERMIPDAIPAAKRKPLETYLEKLEKPKEISQS